MDSSSSISLTRAAAKENSPISPVPAPIISTKTVPKSLILFQNIDSAIDSMLEFFKTAAEKEESYMEADSKNIYRFRVLNIPESLQNNEASSVKAALIALIETVHKSQNNHPYNQLKLHFYKEHSSILLVLRSSITET